MVVAVPGTGGTLKATTIEGMIFEVATLLEIGEDTPANNVGLADRMKIDKFSSSGLLTIDFDIPGSWTVNTSGAHVWTPVEWLSGMTYTRGTGGTLRATSFAGALAEAVDWFKQAEIDPLKNPLGEAHTTYSYGQRGVNNFRGSIELKFIDTVNALGNVVTAISPWYA
jgi:hypothetical protein